MGILRAPHVLVAVDPRYAGEFLLHDARSSLAILGAVFPCVTGTEAMYADMGHLGRAAIRLVGWQLFCQPSF
jgi:KUP system potassium uptake protein